MKSPYAVENFAFIDSIRHKALSYEMGFIKPDPRFFIHVLRKFRLKLMKQTKERKRRPIGRRRSIGWLTTSGRRKIRPPQPQQRPEILNVHYLTYINPSNIYRAGQNLSTRPCRISGRVMCGVFHPSKPSPTKWETAEGMRSRQRCDSHIYPN